MKLNTPVKTSVPGISRGFAMTLSIPSRAAGTAIAASLGLLTVLGPAAIDMYLPSIPQMATDLGTSYASMQLSLTVFLLAQGAGQLVFGPVIDAFGRRRPVIWGLIAFVLASLATTLASSIGVLLAARFAQGLAASLILVVAMSSVRDVASGVRAAQIFATLMAIQGVAPILAPAFGGMIGAVFGWRAVLLTLGLLGLVVLVNTLINLPETLPPEKRTALRLSGTLRTYAGIVSSADFLIPALALSGVFFFLFAYIGGAAYAYQTGYGLSTGVFGFVFGGTGIAILFGALAAGRFARRFSVQKLALWSVLLMLAGAIIGLISAISGLGLPGIVFGMVVAVFGLGMGESTLVPIALASRDTALGASVAVLGALQMIIASAATPLAGAIAEKGPAPWLGFLIFSALVVVALTFVSVRRSQRSGRAVTMQH